MLQMPLPPQALRLLLTCWCSSRIRASQGFLAAAGWSARQSNGMACCTGCAVSILLFLTVLFSWPRLAVCLPVRPSVFARSRRPPPCHPYGPASSSASATPRACVLRGGEKKIEEGGRGREKGKKQRKEKKERDGKVPPSLVTNFEADQETSRGT